MSEADESRDLHAVLRPSLLAGPGRKLRECIALAQDYEAALGEARVPDEDFAHDVQAGIDSRRDSFAPPEWE